jgi:hypothetical protein
MQRVMWVGGIVFFAFCLGCGPIKVRIETPGIEGAQARIHAAGSTADAPACSTPCSVEVDRNAPQEITVVAPGYYPATFVIDYERAYSVTFSQGVSEPVLLVPLHRISK